MNEQKLTLVETKIGEAKKIIDQANLELQKQGPTTIWLTKTRQALTEVANQMPIVERSSGSLDQHDKRVLNDFRSRIANGFRSLAKIQTAVTEQQSLVCFVTTPIINEKILINDFSIPFLEKDNLEINACRGEFEPVSFTILALEDADNISITVSDIKGPDTIPGSAFDISLVKCWYQAGDGVYDIRNRQLVPELLLKDDALVKVNLEKRENFVRSTSRDGREEYLNASTHDSTNLKKLSPKDSDILLPFSIKQGQMKQVWLTFQAPGTAKSGNYTAEIIVHSSKYEKRLPVNITIYPFELEPSPLTYSIYYRSQLAKHGLISSEEKDKTQLTAELKDLKNHGILYPSLYQLYSEDLLPEVLQIRDELGFPKDFLFSLGITTNCETPAQIEEFKTNLDKWLKIAKKYNYQKFFIYGIDEASGERLTRQRKIWENVHHAGAKVFVACSKGTFESMGDILNVAVFAKAPDIKEAENFHSKGNMIFSYDNPQVGPEEPLTYRKNFGLLLWQNSYDGAMNYAYQHGFGHIWNDFDHNLYRDHCFAYPTVNGLVDTIQWEGFREGVDDTRYLASLLKAIERASGIKNDMAEKAKEWLANLDLNQDLTKIRKQMAEWIIKLNLIIK